MQIYTRVIKSSYFIFLISFFSACTTDNVLPQSIGSCSIGNICTLDGTLNIYLSNSGSLGILKNSESCISLALPKKSLLNRNTLNGKKVRVQGVIYPNSSAPDVISYTLLDRSVLTGMCGTEKIVYVNTVKLI